MMSKIVNTSVQRSVIDTETKSKALEIHLAEFNNIWSEIMTRIEIRERAIQIGITIQGVLLAAALDAQQLSLKSNNFQVTDILILSPIAACLFQAIFLRQILRIAALSEYIQTELNERITRYLPNNDWITVTGGSALSWLPFFNRKSRRFGSPRIEMFLTIIEFNLPFILGIFGLMVYFFLSPIPYSVLSFISLGVWVLFAIFFLFAEIAAFKMLTGHKMNSAEHTIKSYLKAIHNGDYEFAISLVLPAVRPNLMNQVYSNTLDKPNTKEAKVVVKDNSQPTSRVIKVTIPKNNIECMYLVIQRNNLWYIARSSENLKQRAKNSVN